MPKSDGQTPGTSSLAKARPGDMLLFYRATGLNKFITWFTGSPFYHVAIYAGNNCVVESRPRGVVRRDLRTREGGHTFLVIPAPNDAGEAALAWAETQIGAEYDQAGVLRLILDRMLFFLRSNRPVDGKYSCGEFVAQAFQQAGVTIVPEWPPADVVPGDFARLLPAEEPLRRYADAPRRRRVRK